MKYLVTVPPYTLKFLNVILGQYQDFPKYSLCSIDRESYIISAMVENSDEGWSQEGRMVHNFQIGRYCSMAEDLFFLIGRGKDYEHVSTSAAKVFHQRGEVIGHKHHEKGSIII